MKYELKSIGIWSLVKVSFFVNLVLGGVLGFLYALLFGFIMAVAGGSPMADQYGIDPAELSVGVMIILFPIVGALMGAFFHTLIVALIVGLYNLFVRLTGGLVLNLVDVEPSNSQVIPAPSSVRAEPRFAAPPAPAPVAPPPPPPPVAPEESLREIRKTVETREPQTNSEPKPETPPKASDNSSDLSPSEKKTQNDHPETPPNW